MCRKLVCLVSFVLVLGLTLTSTANAADPNLVGCYNLDGDTINNSGNGHDGTIVGSPTFVPGVYGQALEFPVPGGSGHYVDLGTWNPSEQTGQISCCLWLKWNGVDGRWHGIISKKNSSEDMLWQFHTQLNNGRIRVFQLGATSNWSPEPPVVEEWEHWSFTFDGATVIIYRNGRQVVTNNFSFGTGLNAQLKIGTIGNEEASFNGTLDEVRIYNRALTAVEVQQSMLPISFALGNASNPKPDDGETDVPRNAPLNWTPGKYADQHDVYFGESFEDINDATTDSVVYRGRQSETTYAIGRLDFGQTYYWRIDEVNAPPDFTVFKGDVWSFTAEPYAYPIENIIVTASSEIKAGEGPENTVNGSGLDDDDLHSSDSDDMWLSNFVDPDRAWIQYEFDRVYKLYRMWVWNYNSSVEPMVGFGVKEATIEYSLDGTNWAIFGTTHEFARGPGAAGYAHNTTVDLGGAAAKYVRITANSNWGGMVNQYGLSEVRFLYIPVWATEPSPDSGATDVDVDTILSFRAGREAAKHDVYISTDEQTVIDGTVPVVTVTEPSYTPSLDLAGTYYWRIDEVNDVESPATWQGDIWNLSTQEYLVVDDFESYNDIVAGEEGSNLIYGTWADGFDDPTTNGSTMGYAVPFQPTMETGTVHGGQQSAPMEYNNVGAAFSEITRTLASQNWTTNGIQTLSLWFFGDVNNVPGQLYVKVNGAKVDYDGDAGNLTASAWQAWNIDLASIGVNLQSVTSMAIGVEGAFATGTLLLDDIRLYAYARELITPVEPSNANLVGYYPFDEGEGTVVNDVTGNGPQGTFVDSPTWVESMEGYGTALQFPGGNVSLGTWTPSEKTGKLTLAFWMNWDGTGGNKGPIGKRTGWNADSVYWNVEMNPTGNVQFFSFVNRPNFGTNTPPIGTWQHFAFTFDGVLVRMYVGGVEVGEPQTGFSFGTNKDLPITIGAVQENGGNPFSGMLDEFRFYDDALSPTEIAWLSGRTEPFDKPF